MNTPAPAPEFFDVVIIGAGAAGLMCAAVAGQRGRRVLVLDHANKVGKKILMSGGGRCNFTNLNTGPDNFFSANPHFCKSALKRYSPYDFLALVEKHGVEYVHKEQGQLFCKNSARDILQLLLDECARGGVKIRTRCSVSAIQLLEAGPSTEEPAPRFTLTSSDGSFQCHSLVIATGGLSIPTLGASGFGYDMARRFGLNVLQTRAALVPFTLQKRQLQQLEDLSGLSHEVAVSCGETRLQGAMLFTHRGLSGPVMLQVSACWLPGQMLDIDLFPGLDLRDYLPRMKRQHPQMELKNILAEHMPRRLAQRLCELRRLQGPINRYGEKQLAQLAEALHHWWVKPSGTEGYRTAEVTLGGVDTDEISSKTMQASRVPGLYFIGEVLDVTGQLGGYNFQWAWASGWAAGQVV
jgi:hypothetical protein